MKTRMISKRVFLACLLTCLSAIGFAQDEMQITGNVYLYQKGSNEIHIGDVLLKQCTGKKEAENLAGKIKKLATERNANPHESDREDRLCCFLREQCSSSFEVKRNGKFSISCVPGMYLLFVETENYHTKIVKVKKGKTEYKNIGIESFWHPVSSDEESVRCHPELSDKKVDYDGKTPRFPGGRNAFSHYLCDRFKRSYQEDEKDTIRNVLEGIVGASFSVDKDGTVRNIKCEQLSVDKDGIARNISDSPLAKEVSRYLHDMPQWQTAKKAIDSQYVIIEFLTYDYWRRNSHLFSPYENRRIFEGLQNNTRIALVKDTIHDRMRDIMLHHMMDYDELSDSVSHVGDDRLVPPHIFVVGKRLSKILSQSEGRITFEVDENLEPRKDEAYYNGDEGYITKRIIENVGPYEPAIVATSFENDKHIAYMGPSALFRSAVNAYACHQSICFSPDMIWLLICQGFSRYVNAHAEELRPLLVNHEGQKDLNVITDENLLKDRSAWPSILNGFAHLIKKNTKEDIAETIMKSYSTTGTVEKIASEITLMDCMKAYFKYKAIGAPCGIPSITLTGTPDDWHDLAKRTEKLEKYGLGEWTKSLEPILEEFENAAKGKPNQKFWQGIVKQVQVDELERRACMSPLEIDGWILRFYPDKGGHTPEKVAKKSKLTDEMLKVDFEYSIPRTNESYNLELWAGFIGAEKDTINNVIVPKIGWFVRHAKNDIPEDLIEGIDY